ncbi:uncharacterized protein [Linepithema humile]|uniref:uncharacterized protein isoform X2 n=1 Tax=Linepithema humile TaxID=83485 RepID=UPI00351DE6F9
MYNYQRIETQIHNYCWQRKWTFLIALVCIIFIIFLIWHSTDKTVKYDTYLDDVPENLYQEGEEWYNKKNIFALSPEAFQNLLTDVRQNWIIWNHNENESYDLQEPNVEDPSMGQSTVIREILNEMKNGFFIECGAYDGETRSNTLFLERFNGWSGLLIEADPINFTKMLQKNRRAYLSPTCLSVINSPSVKFFLMAKNVGRLHEPENTTQDAPTNSPDVAYTGKHIRVQCFPLSVYIAALGVKTVDYFSLDVEGNEIDVLETIPFNEVDIKVLSVEYIHNAKKDIKDIKQYMIDMMKQRGYYVYKFVERSDNLANDIIFVKRDV